MEVAKSRVWQLNHSPIFSITKSDFVPILDERSKIARYTTQLDDTEIVFPLFKLYDLYQGQ